MQMLGSFAEFEAQHGPGAHLHGSSCGSRRGQDRREATASRDQRHQLLRPKQKKSKIPLFAHSILPLTLCLAILPHGYQDADNGHCGAKNSFENLKSFDLKKKESSDLSLGTPLVWRRPFIYFRRSRSGTCVSGCHGLALLFGFLAQRLAPLRLDVCRYMAFPGGAEALSTNRHPPGRSDATSVHNFNLNHNCEGCKRVFRHRFGFRLIVEEGLSHAVLT
jgi:hypothetical protein